MKDNLIPAIILLIGIGITIGACIRLKRATAEKDLFLCIVLIFVSSLIILPVALFTGLYVIIKWPRESKQKQNYEEQISQLQAENDKLRKQLNNQPRPGSAAHYEAWRAERMKQNGKE